MLGIHRRGHCRHRPLLGKQNASGARQTPADVNRIHHAALLNAVPMTVANRSDRADASLASVAATGTHKSTTQDNGEQGRPMQSEWVMDKVSS